MRYAGGLESSSAPEIRPMPDPCPSRDDLAAFAAGDLPRAALERVARHAEACDHCGQALDALDGTTDPLVASLRSPAETDSAWTVPDRVRSALLALGTGEPAATGPAP